MFLLLVLGQAETAHLEAMRIRESNFGPEHDTVAQSAQYLSLLLLNAGTISYSLRQLLPVVGSSMDNW